MKAISTIIQYIFLIAIALLCFRGCDFHHLAMPLRPAMSWHLVVPFGLSLAYLWVDVFRWGITKPFNCLSCMTGWFSLVIAGLFHVPFWYFYLPAGVFVGGLYSSFRMRWL